MCLWKQQIVLIVFQKVNFKEYDSCDFVYFGQIEKNAFFWIKRKKLIN